MKTELTKTIFNLAMNGGSVRYESDGAIFEIDAEINKYEHPKIGFYQAYKDCVNGHAKPLLHSFGSRLCLVAEKIRPKTLN